MTQDQKQIVLFGEVLMRLAPPQYQRLVQARELEYSFTGGEANAGELLATLGCAAYPVSAVPEHELGQACINHLRRFGLDPKYVQRRGHRLGTYYLETGASFRPTKVIYDRRGSAFAELQPGDVPWDEIFRDKHWLHFTGTAPALSVELLELVLEGCTAAQQAGLTVSCDLNYRSQLWSIAEAATAFARIVPLVDVLIANEEHARLILGAEVGAKYEGHDPFSSDRYRGQLTALRRQFDLSHVALTVRSGNTADETRFAAVLDDGRSCAMSRDYRIRVIDRVGAGDAFSGGLIYGLLHGWDVGRVVEFAAAAGCWKHTVHGDFSHASLDELLALVEHGQAGRVAR